MKRLNEAAVLFVLAKVTCVACSTDSTRNVTLAPSDVSFLIPLRSVENFGARTIGGRGTIMPRTYFDQLEALTRVDEPDALYDQLDVVGVRLDPCFTEGLSTDNCDSQIRLILQPVVGSDEEFVARDATVHAFYRVPADELVSLAESLAMMRLETGARAAIGQHPDPGRAAAQLLPHLGDERLTRLTFVSVHASDQAWSFGGVDVVNGELVHLEIVGVSEHEQHLTSLGSTDTLDAAIFPEPVVESQAMKFMELILRDEMSSAEQEIAKAGLRRLLDPAVHNPGTVDCASCHMATASAYFIDGHLGYEIPEVYGNTQNQRMFGFFGLTQSISPRVNAETEVVLRTFEGLQ